MTVRTAAAAAALLAAALAFGNFAFAAGPAGGSGASGPAIGSGFRIGSPYATPDYSGTAQPKKKRAVRARSRGKSHAAKPAKPAPAKASEEAATAAKRDKTEPVETGTVDKSATAGAPQTCRKYEPTIGRTIEISCE